jgi:hypothetical protein
MEFESAYELAEHYKELIFQLPYPDKADRIPKPIRENFPNNETFGKALDEWEEVEKRDKELRNKLLREYREAVSKLEGEFKVALLKYLGLTQNKQSEKLYSMAWERGHSSGLGEVAMEAGHLAELIR